MVVEGLNANSVSNELEYLQSFDRVFVHDVELVDEWVLGLLPSLQLAFSILIQDLLVGQLILKVLQVVQRTL